MSETAPFRFEVQSGLYAGLSDGMSAGSRTIGSGLDADLVFIEQNLEPHHLRVTLSDGAIAIEALAPGVVLEGFGQIATGSRAEADLPALVHIGGMSLRWSDETRPLPAFAGMPRFSASTLAVAVFALLILTGLTTFIYDASADAPVATASVSTGTAPARSFASGRPDEAGTKAAASALQTEIDKAGLLNIKVGSGPGVVAAEGTIEPSLMADWQKLQQWFDHRYTGTLTLVNGVTVKEEKLPSSIAVEAVWQGTQPHLLVRGQKYFIGAMLDDGWTIHRIEGDRVLLSRDGRLAAVRY